MCVYSFKFLPLGYASIQIFFSQKQRGGKKVIPLKILDRDHMKDEINQFLHLYP